MQTLLNVVNYIVGLGAAVFLPFIMTALGLIFGLKLKESIHSGVLFGVAFTAMSLFISQLLVGQIAPQAQHMITSTGLKLTSLDVGWTAASMISWAWPYAATMFPIQIGVNLIFLAIGWTNTLIVDLWNVWYKIFIAAIVYFFTHNLFLSYVVAIAGVIIELKLGDYLAPYVQEASGIPEITVPHFGMIFILPLMPLVYLLDRIPFFNNHKFDITTLKKKIGFIGDPLILGLMMGALIGVLSKSDIATILKLSVTVATIMIVLPRIATLFSEALQPIADAASSFMKKRFPGKKFYIGLDWPVLAGNEAVLTSSILLIPVLIILAMFLPGNKTLPFGDVANFSSLIIGFAVLFKGDLLKTLIASIPALMIALWGSSAAAVPFTKLAQSVGFKMPANATQITWLKTSPVVWALFEFLQKNYLISIVLVILFAISFYILKRYYVKDSTEHKSGKQATVGAK